MSERQKTLQLKTYNKDFPVTLLYDQCKSGESNYGPWMLYGVEYEGEQQGIFAEDALHQELKKYGKNVRLIIRRNQDENGKLEWQVTPANGNSQTRSTKTVSSFIDEKSASIQRAMALKIAVISIGASTRAWTNDDLKEIRSRMSQLCEILNGSDENELPF
jgi:hypothetical protein